MTGGWFSGGPTADSSKGDYESNSGVATGLPRAQAASQQSIDLTVASPRSMKAVHRIAARFSEIRRNCPPIAPFGR